MGKTNKFFLDIREVDENIELFDHEKLFCEKVKYKWFTTEKFQECLNMDLVQLTSTLIEYSKEGAKIDYQDRDWLINSISILEPSYLGKKHEKYMLLILDTPIDNMVRIFKKYTEDGLSGIRQNYRLLLETEIMKKKRLANELG